jgi:hypothetical protein
MLKSKKEKQKERRERQFGPKADWIRTLPCAACGRDGPSDPAHMRSRGAGGTSDHLVPLCRMCHTEQHAKGIKTFFSKHGIIDTLDLADQYHQRWINAKRSGFTEYWQSREDDILY